MALWKCFLELRTFECAVTGRGVPLLPKPYYTHISKSPCPPSESILQRDCIKCFRSVGWKVAAHEWKAVRRDGKMGVGDLVFKKGNVAVVIECKRRTKQKVFDQAVFYSHAWAETNPSHIVLYGIWTCKEQQLLGRI